MITEIILPKLGQTMEEGTIVEWLKQEGDAIHRDEILFTVETDKAVIEVEATANGFLRKILVPAGQTVPVLAVVALLTATPDEEISGYRAAEPQIGRGVLPPPVQGTEGLPPVAPSEVPGRLFASPRARKTAQEKRIDLSLVTGTGPGGRIVEHDVLRAATQGRPFSSPALPAAKTTPLAAKAAQALGVDLAAVPATGISGRIMKADVEAAAQVVAERFPGIGPERGRGIPAPSARLPIAESVPVAGLRRIIAERMATSHQTAARVTLVTEVDATVFAEGREQLKAAVESEWDFAPGYNDLLGFIVARALRESPYMNARLSADSQTIERLPYVNLGMAVDTERGLLVPVIRNADQKGLRAFGAEFRTLVERARLGKSLPDDLSGGTFTITNLGMYDIDAFTPIINLPEVAILGAGRIQARPVVYRGQIVARQMWTLSLSFDHRLVDGAPAARFLQRIKQLIESPYLLLG
jgi:pyruvate dehydrogenase E2 component (dihydrolipoyllysine-residue acetyltransferase)